MADEVAAVSGLRVALIVAATVLGSAGVSGILAAVWVGAPFGKVAVFECVCWAWFTVCVVALRSASNAKKPRSTDSS